MKIGKKLIIMIIALTILGIGALLGTVVNISQTQITTLVNSELEKLGGNQATIIKAWMDKNFSMVRA
ncbi:MAG: hypothetical protein LBF77_07930, partial [Spirochaetaceae bacterium]|nr:hypothetical protein [Spirochaetaceae bacterium]